MAQDASPPFLVAGGEALAWLSSHKTRVDLCREGLTFAASGRVGEAARMASGFLEYCFADFGTLAG